MGKAKQLVRGPRRKDLGNGHETLDQKGSGWNVRNHDSLECLAKGKDPANECVREC